MIYKKIVTLLLMAFATGSTSVLATGWPVYCYNCEDATRGAAKMIGGQLQVQTRALVEALDGTTVSRNSIQVATIESEMHKANARLYDPRLGAIPRDGCQLAKIGNMVSGARTRTRVQRYNLGLGAKINGELASELKSTDDPQMFTATRTVARAIQQDEIIRQLKRGEIDEQVGIAVTADAINGANTLADSGETLPDGKTAFQTALDYEWQRLDPNPPPMNPELKKEGAELSDAEGPENIKAHARAVEYNNTNEVAKSIINRIMIEKNNSLDATEAKKIADDNDVDYADQIIDDRISPAAMRALMNSYRIQSSGQWYSDNDSGTEILLARDANKISAQSLSNEEKIIQRMDENNRAQAHIISLLNQIRYLLQDKQS